MFKWQSPTAAERHQLQPARFGIFSAGNFQSADDDGPNAVVRRERRGVPAGAAVAPAIRCDSEINHGQRGFRSEYVKWTEEGNGAANVRKTVMFPPNKK